MKVMSIFGTRPEAIKMCPLIKELALEPQIKNIVCLSGQHREMLQQVLEVFNIDVDYSLDIMRPGQDLFTITTDVLSALVVPLKESSPDIVLVHGDTTTSFAAAMAAFYLKIPVGHVEAGLRTWNRYSPFPEEMNRTLTGRIAELHFAPTDGNKKNLEHEGITKGVFVTGNTIIDAFKTTLQQNYVFHEPKLNKLPFSEKRIVLVTAHRRENFGRPFEQIFTALQRLHGLFPDVQFVYPVHLNTTVRECAFRMLGSYERIMLVDPINVADMHNLIAKSYLLMTDSGGLQEEAPHCGVPVLVLRTETERPEAAEAGTVQVVGVETESIIQAAATLLSDPIAHKKMTHAINPYGDGNASKRIIRHLLEWHGTR